MKAFRQRLCLCVGILRLQSQVSSALVNQLCICQYINDCSQNLQSRGAVKEEWWPTQRQTAISTGNTEGLDTAYSLKGGLGGRDNGREEQKDC